MPHRKCEKYSTSVAKLPFAQLGLVSTQESAHIPAGSAINNVINKYVICYITTLKASETTSPAAQTVAGDSMHLQNLSCNRSTMPLTAEYNVATSHSCRNSVAHSAVPESACTQNSQYESATAVQYVWRHQAGRMQNSYSYCKRSQGCSCQHMHDLPPSAVAAASLCMCLALL